MSTFNTLLKLVSRTFYLSLRVLPAPIRPVMGLGYIFCRAADSIADTELVPRAERLERLREFGELLSSFPVSENRLSTFMNKTREALAGATGSDALLLQNTPLLIKLFNERPLTDQALIQEVTLAVIRGMEMDLTTFGDSVETLAAFSTVDELERYIGYIGGDPGRFWSRVLLQYGLANGANREKLLEDGFAFGKGVQMINILRDMPNDLKHGRCYLPLEILTPAGLTPQDLAANQKTELFLTLYHRLIDQTIGRLRHGTLYLDQLAWHDVRVRAAVWWPLSIGLKSLAHLRQSSTILSPTAKNKIKRSELYKVIGGSLIYLPWSRLLRWEFERLAEDASSSL